MSSKQFRNIPNFKGPFFSWSIALSIDREKSSQELLHVFSSGNRASCLKFLWFKLVWDELSKDEFLLFITLPETLTNDKIVGFLRARLEVDKRILRDRLIMMETILEGKVTSHSRYLGYKRYRLDIQRKTSRLPKVKKFSGYVRNIASLGKGSRGSSIPEPSSKTLEIIENQTTDWYYLLTVGELTLFSRELRLPDETQEGRNGNPKIIIKS